MLEWLGLLMSIYVPGPGFGALICLLQVRSSDAPKGTVVVSS